MFSKVSRYRKLSDVVTKDAQGRELESKSIRLLPEVPGKFLHMVEEVDRLDHLGYKYYKQPRNWWRICDANPEFLSSQALLGKEPLITQRFPVDYNGPELAPPWAGLLARLSESVGVENVRLEKKIVLVDELQEIGGEQVTVHVERFYYKVVITYNKMNTDIAELSELIHNADFDVSEPQIIERIGKQIIIPPPVVG